MDKKLEYALMFLVLGFILLFVLKVVIVGMSLFLLGILIYTLIKRV